MIDFDAHFLLIIVIKIKSYEIKKAKSFMILIKKQK
jgi:hypothetical protein